MRTYKNVSLFIISWAGIYPISLTKVGREKNHFQGFRSEVGWSPASACAPWGYTPVTNPGGPFCFQSSPTRGSSTSTRPSYTRTTVASFHKRLGICTSQRLKLRTRATTRAWWRTRWPTAGSWAPPPRSSSATTVGLRGGELGAGVAEFVLFSLIGCYPEIQKWPEIFISE